MCACFFICFVKRPLRKDGKEMLVIIVGAASSLHPLTPRGSLLEGQSGDASPTMVSIAQFILEANCKAGGRQPRNRYQLAENLCA